MDTKGSVRVAFETARLQLAGIRADAVGARGAAYQLACRVSAATLNVDRVSIWLLKEGGQQIECMCLFERATEGFSKGGSLIRTDCPAYFDALNSHRVISASDARRDPKTRELGAYLVSHDVHALLDAPIYRDGTVLGVVCHEVVGGPRAWSERDAGFASAVADMLTILIEQAERAELRAALAAERQAEARAQKMDALRRMARIVAHDLNNVLLVAMARTSPEPGPAGAAGKDAEQDAEVAHILEYGAKLVKQLGSFADDHEVEASVELGGLLGGLAPSLRALIGKGTVFDLEVAPGRHPVAISPAEAEQLVLNLCMNAMDAVRGAGSIHVRLAPEPATERVVLEVRDTGVGMDDETQMRIFEPYFTTKADHAGVGLMAVYGIVRRSGGAIWLDSAPGKGTCFRVALPLERRRQDVGEVPWAF